MKSKERIIVEEIGCDEEQAKLSLRESSDNLQKAIKSIASTFKFIGVIKGKFICEDINMYGLFIVIVNLRKEIIIRQAAVVTNNPAIYENDMGLTWHIFEKRLYALRLHEGSLHETTSKFEQNLNRQIRKNHKQIFFQLVREKKAGELAELLKSGISKSLPGASNRLVLEIEELSLSQFRELSDKSVSVTEKKNDNNNSGRELTLETELAECNDDGDFVEADKLKENDTVLVSITDNRDTAQYLSKLLGGRKRDSIIPLAATIQKVDCEGNNLTVDMRFGPGITGRALVNKKTRVRIVKSHFKNAVRRRIIIWFTVASVIAVGIVYFVLKIVVD